MKRMTPLPGALQIIGGYLAAVAVAAISVASIMAVSGPDAGIFLPVIIIGGIYIGAAGLPGFALMVYVSRQHGWSGWLPFAIAGGLNALLAWYLVNGAQPFRLTASDSTLLLASVRGGVAGGVAYWWAAYHGLRRGVVGRAAELG
jgi:hypothetical protein